MASLNPKIQVIPQTVLFTQSINNNLTINSLGNTTQNIRQSTSQNATLGTTSTLIPSSPNIVRIPSSSTQQPQQIPSALWSSIQGQLHQQQQQQQQQQQNGVIQTPTQIQAVQVQGIQRSMSQQQIIHPNHMIINKQVSTSPIVQYNTIKTEPIQHTSSGLQTVVTQRPQIVGTSNLILAPNNQQQQWQQLSSTSLALPTTLPSPTVMTPTALIAATKPPLVIQQQKPQQVTFTESQVIDFVSKCRTFLTTLLKLAEKQAPDKLPMVKQCIQDLLEGTIDPESFTERLHTLYKSQPHMSLVPFFKLALPHMRQIVKQTFNKPITIELLEKLSLPTTSSTTSITQPTSTSATIVQQQPQHVQQFQNNSNTTTTNIIQSSLKTLNINTYQQQQQNNNTNQIPTSIIGTTSLLNNNNRQHVLTGVRPYSTTQSPHVTSITIQQPQQTTLLATGEPTPVRPLTAIPTPIIVNHQQIKTTQQQTQRSSIRGDIDGGLDESSQGDLSDVAVLAGVNLNEEKQRINSASDQIGQVQRHCVDEKFLNIQTLKRKAEELARNKQMPEISDDSLALISHATQERLKNIVDQLRLITQHRCDLAMKNDSSYEQIGDVKAQIRFLEELDKIEKQRKEKAEQEKILRAAKSRSKTNDPEAVKLKQKAKEMQQAQVEEQRQKEANETALAAIGQRKKRKLDDLNGTVNGTNGATNQSGQGITSTKASTRKRVCRANLRDLLLIMERDRYLKKSNLLFRAYNK